METAQLLIDLATRVVGESLSSSAASMVRSSSRGSTSSSSSQPTMGAKNQIYYMSLSKECPPHLVPMLTSIVNGTISSRSTLVKIARQTNLFSPSTALLTGTAQRPEPELLVVLYECLLGSRRVRGSSPVVKLVKERKKDLQIALAGKRKEGKEKGYVERVKLPRYVRVNILKCTMDDARRHFVKEYKLKEITWRDNHGNSIQVSKGTFLLDPVIPNLFCLPPSTSLHTDKLVANGALVLQDRSSCLTATVLDPPPSAKVIDTCASPGNKTLHVASIMYSKFKNSNESSNGNVNSHPPGRITAFERDPTRIGTLSRRIVEQGAENFCSAVMADCRSVNFSDDFCDVTHCLVDPSCSGSGLASLVRTGAGMESEYETAEGQLGNAEKTEKVNRLANEQVEILLKCMRKLPSLQVLAYSTCSVYREENEDVVARVLSENDIKEKWQQVNCLVGWAHRGLDECGDIGKKSVRATVEKDSTNGFFVARFERRRGVKRLREKPGEDGEKKNKEEMNMNKKNKEKSKKKKEHKTLLNIANRGDDEIDQLLAEWD